MAEISEEIVVHPEQLSACCAELERCPHFGFDTEFVGEDSYHPRLCLIQVATPERLYLIDPLSAGPLDAFWKLVVDPSRVVVVHAGREEVRLCRLWTGHPPGRLFDLQLAAGLAGFTYPIGHGSLVYQLVGAVLAKGETLTEWRHRPLTTAQVRYAFDDVRYLLPAWEELHRRLARLDRLSWAEEEFARLTASTAPETLSTEKWRKLRGLGSLDRRRLAIVRALYAWREERAQQSNRPARTIVRDDLLVEIGRRSPTRARDLQVVRGLPRRELDAIVGVVAEARALPLEQCPELAEREQDPPQVGLVSSVLNAALADLCCRWQLAPSLTATTADIKLLLRARMAGMPLPKESLLTQGWRAQHVLPELLALLEGRRSLRIADLRAEAPFAYREESGTP